MKKKILILAKTYPNLSKKYEETVCTAGIDEQGNWIRLYPIQFRKKEEYEQYKKYQWIEVDVIRNETDKRKESYRLLNDNITLGNKVDTKNNWFERRNIVLNNQKIYTNIQDVIDTNKKDNGFSLCIFKPKEILDFIVEDNDKYEEELEKKKTLEEKRKQQDFFEERNKNFSFMPRLDKKFSYKFKDSTDTVHCLQVEDWETGQLYLNSKKDVEKVKNKYLNDFKTKDLHFFLGTQKRYDGWSKNPFIIIGIFYPPLIKEEFDLFSYLK